jgi:hypothetical protein
MGCGTTTYDYRPGAVCGTVVGYVLKFKMLIDGPQQSTDTPSAPGR